MCPSVITSYLFQLHLFHIKEFEQLFQISMLKIGHFCAFVEKMMSKTGSKTSGIGTKKSKNGDYNYRGTIIIYNI